MKSGKQNVKGGIRVSVTWSSYAYVLDLYLECTVHLRSTYNKTLPTEGLINYFIQILYPAHWLYTKFNSFYHNRLKHFSLRNYRVQSEYWCFWGSLKTNQYICLFKLAFNTVLHKYSWGVTSDNQIFWLHRLWYYELMSRKMKYLKIFLVLI